MKMSWVENFQTFNKWRDANSGLENVHPGRTSGPYVNNGEVNAARKEICHPIS